MQVFKSTADLDAATKMFQGYSHVDDKFMRIRDIVIANRKPRRLEVQGNLLDPHTYQAYDDSFEGIIHSYLDRYPLFDLEMYHLWTSQKQTMRPNF